MTYDVQITCVVKANRSDPHERISFVGGINPDGTRWKLSLIDAVRGVQEGKYRFWTHGGGRSVWVILGRSAGGHLYLKTENDGISPDNLLALASCP